ncbi:Uncharacterized protein FWK35_00016487 [Aphis craccivora]|uniref:Reverse transcriptase domain-containing protein n=1 Tax=Aphis craccivora TaxID=307492 RepID=A0A6G0Y2Q7_APHCR|nr:Uncharacterized protein FWK35_00016487 [Aphis craccivora]
MSKQCYSRSISKTYILALILDSGVFPKIFKLSSVTPIFHIISDISDVGNYRPITINMDEQHGIRPGRSATNYVLVFVNYMYNTFSNGNQVDVIYTDFRKAFDKADQ